MSKDLYPKLVENAKKYKKIYHYTNIEALAKILNNNSLRLSRLSKVNDVFEEKRADMLWQGKIFVLCFTYRDTESFMFWELYAGHDKGVMLEFDSEYFVNHDFEVFADEKCTIPFKEYIKTDVNHERNIDYNDWLIRDITFAQVEYTDDFNKQVAFDEELADFFNFIKNKDCFKHTLYPGLIKGIEWDNEQELRLRVALQFKGKSNSKQGSPKTPFDYIYIPINDVLPTLKVTMNPFHNDEFEGELRKILESNPLTKNCEIKESSMRNQVKHKE